MPTTCITFPLSGCTRRLKSKWSKPGVRGAKLRFRSTGGFNLRVKVVVGNFGSVGLALSVEKNRVEWGVNVFEKLLLWLREHEEEGWEKEEMRVVGTNLRICFVKY